MDQWLCIEQNYLLPAAKKVMAREYAKMMKLADPGPAVVEEGERESAVRYRRSSRIGSRTEPMSLVKHSASPICAGWRICTRWPRCLRWRPYLQAPASSRGGSALAERAEWKRAVAELASYGPKSPSPT